MCGNLVNRNRRPLASCTRTQTMPPKFNLLAASGYERCVNSETKSEKGASDKKTPIYGTGPGVRTIDIRILFERN